MGREPRWHVWVGPFHGLWRSRRKAIAFAQRNGGVATDADGTVIYRAPERAEEAERVAS